MSLREELLAGITKSASTQTESKQKISDLTGNELAKLASELAAITGDNDLAAMANILPVYGSGAKVDSEIATEQDIKNAKPEVTPTPAEIEAEKDDISVVASAEDSDIEKQAEEDEKEEDKEDKKDSEEDKEDDKEEAKEDEEDTDKQASYTEILFEMLKVAAEEELAVAEFDKLASERAYEMIKEAEDMEAGRAITDHAAVALTDNPMKAHEYSQQMMDQARTVAAANDVSIPEAAQAVAATVVSQAATPEKQASYFLSLLDKEAAAVEYEYEKIAEEVGAIAEQMILAEGMKMGLNDVKLHEFTQRALEGVKTLAAKRNVNLAQAAQMYLAGDRGSMAATLEPTSPSPSQAPNPVKAPINSNQTQDPDQFVAQMANDPNVAVAPAEQKVAGEIDFGLVKMAKAYLESVEAQVKQIFPDEK